MWLRRRRSQRDFEEEIRSHLDLEADRLIAEGHSAHDARFVARRRFGNVGAAQERYHDRRRLGWFEDLGKDIRYAVRMLRKTPGFTIVVVLTLALGVGANTAVFSVVNTVLLRALPYRDPGRVVRLWETLPGMSQIMLSYPDYLDWKTRTRVFDGIALFSPFRSMSLMGGDLPERIGVGSASANLFPMLGIVPTIGRDLRDDDDRPGAARVAVLTTGWWRQRFAASNDVLGRRLTLDGETYTVVGVIPPTPGLGDVDLWIPVGLSAGTPNFSRANHPGLIGLGRLKAGISLEQMNADLERVSSQLRAEFPTDDAGIGGGGHFINELMVRDVRPALRILVWSVALVLLIACVNVANLVLGRSATRRKEIAVRAAMGAGTARIVRLLLAEHLLLAAGGGACGVALAYAGVKAVVKLRPSGVPRLSEIHIDTRVLVFAAVVAIVTGLLFGVLPALQSSRVDLNDALKESGRGASTGGAAMRLRGALMTAEVAMAMMLLIGAGLLLRSFANLTKVDPGVDARGVAVGWISLPEVKYPDEARQRIGMADILRRVQAVPGVGTAALTSAFPLSPTIQNKFTFEGHPQAKGKEPLLNIDLISPDYFATLRIRVLAGRGILASDAAGASLVAVISEAVARKYFPNENPVGKRIVHGAFDAKEPAYTVVGVVSDVKEESLDSKSVGTIYVSFDQGPQSWVAIAVRSALPPEQLFPAMRRAIAEFDRDLPLSNQALLEDMIGESIGQEKFTMFMLGVFAAVALVLAAVGVYGVIAFFVAQRSHEIGIRMALGAQRGDIVTLIGWRVFATTAVGIAIGLVGAVAASDMMTKLLFDITALDTTTYVSGAATLVAAACLAAIVPTLRATRVNPARTMRAD